ncbi:MAG: zinc ABC transporter solute-binding protein [Epsilonproteobacteria bacterium]|nr:zinc ABC transporter solute-binding protein [Campylobacterota bacterium]
MKSVFLIIIASWLYAYNVTVSILPQKFVIDRISSHKATVNVMLPKGANPVMYSPSIAQLKSLKNTLVYFRINVPFEKAYIDKFKAINPSMQIVNFAKYIDMDANPHIWLDPILLISQAKVVYETLSHIDEANAQLYHQNFLKFKQDMIDFDNMIRHTKFKYTKFLIFHPNLYYFAKRYHLQEIAIEKDAKESSFKYLLEIINTAKQNNIKIIFASAEFNPKSARFIAQKVGARVYIFSALKYNILDTLSQVVKILHGSNQ